MSKSTESNVTNAKTNSPLTVPLVELKAVFKTYHNAAGDFPALHNFSANVYPGEFLGVIGKSGAGKSTLLNMITGVDDVTTGQVLVNTNGTIVSIHNLKEDELALWRGQNMGVIFQSFQLLSMLTLLENVMLPMTFQGYSENERRKRGTEHKFEGNAIAFNSSHGFFVNREYHGTN